MLKLWDPFLPRLEFLMPPFPPKDHIISTIDIHCFPVSSRVSNHLTKYIIFVFQRSLTIIDWVGQVVIISRTFCQDSLMVVLIKQALLGVPHSEIQAELN